MAREGGARGLGFDMLKGGTKGGGGLFSGGLV
jgi:hypothetical protein